jgi:hypothetical protein
LESVRLNCGCMSVCMHGWADCWLPWWQQHVYAHATDSLILRLYFPRAALSHETAT